MLIICSSFLCFDICLVHSLFVFYVCSKLCFVPSYFQFWCITSDWNSMLFCLHPRYLFPSHSINFMVILFDFVFFEWKLCVFFGFKFFCGISYLHIAFEGAHVHRYTVMSHSITAEIWQPQHGNLNLLFFSFLFSTHISILYLPLALWVISP